MKLLIDIHVHSVSSGHAYSTIDEIALHAKREKLEIVALTDHASAMPGAPHPYHFANIRVLPEYMHGVRVLKGVEANIMDYDGSLDYDNEMLEGLELELVIASLHPPCIDPADKETITKTIMKTMENPYVHIIGHPGDDRYPMDFEKIVQHAKKHNVLLEVNNASLTPNSYRSGVEESLAEILKYSLKYDHPIIIGSDAHYHEDVGGFKESIALLKEANFPEHLVMNANTEKFMKFIQKGR